MKEKAGRLAEFLPQAACLFMNLLMGCFFMSRCCMKSDVEKRNRRFPYCISDIIKEGSPLIGQARRFFLEALGGVLGALGFGGA